MNQLHRFKRKGVLWYHTMKNNQVVQAILTNREFHVKDLARRLNTSPMTILIVVGRLKKEGIIREVRIR